MSLEQNGHCGHCRSGRARKKKSLGDDYVSEPDRSSMNEKIYTRDSYAGGYAAYGAQQGYAQPGYDQYGQQQQYADPAAAGQVRT